MRKKKDSPAKIELEKYNGSASELHHYQLFFENAPCSLWIEDLSAIKTYIDSLRAQGVTDIPGYFTSHPEEVSRCFSLMRILDVNQATLDLFKATDKPTFIRDIHRIAGDASYPAFKETILAIAEGKTQCSLESVNYTFTGDKLYLLLSWVVAPGFESSYARVLVTVFDITKQKQAEESLRQNELRFKTQYESNPIPTFTWQKTADDDFQLIAYNQAAEKLTNGRVKQFLGKTAKELYHDREDILHDLQQCFTEKTVVFRELISQHFVPGKLVLATYAYIEPDLIMVRLEDITERKQAEVQLEMIHDLYRRAITQANAVPYQMNYVTWQYDYLGEGIERLTGYTAEEFNKTDVRNKLVEELEIYGEAAGLSLSEAIRRARAGLIRQWSAQMRIRTKSGQTKWLADTAIQLFDAHGNVYGSLGILQDITDQKQAEITLREQNELLLLQTRVAQITAEGKTIDECCTKFTALLREIMPCDAFFIDAYNETTKNTIGIKAYDTINGTFQEIGLTHVQFNPEGDIYKTVILQRKPYLNLRKPGIVEKFKPILVGDTSRRSESLLYIPLVVKDRIVGIISIQSYQPNAYTTRHIELLMAIVPIIAPAFEALLLTEHLRVSEERYRTIFERAVEGMFQSTPE
ncbi:MAG: PAS domain S-box protein, partial [bacterium]|nr:PAS domain S-box protein [bacterium]